MSWELGVKVHSLDALHSLAITRTVYMYSATARTSSDPRHSLIDTPLALRYWCRCRDLPGVIQSYLQLLLAAAIVAQQPEGQEKHDGSLLDRRACACLMQHETSPIILAVTELFVFVKKTRRGGGFR